MPTTVGAHQNHANTKERTGLAENSRASDATRSDDWNRGAEGVTGKKRSQHSSSSSAANTRSILLHAHTKANNADKPSFNSRRRQSSIPNARPMGARELQGKRSVSNGIALSSNPVKATPGASYDHPLHQASINDISRFSFASIIPQTAPTTSSEDDNDDSLDFGDFLDPVNFADFHDNITATDPAEETGPSPSHFPLPGRGVGNKSPDEERTSIPIPIAPQAGTRKVSVAGSIGKKNNLFRQQSNASSNLGRTRSKSGSVASMTTATPTTSALKTRRRSQFPPSALINGVSNTVDPKTVRKEATPGTEASSEDIFVRRRPSIGRRKVSADSQKTFANTSKNNHSAGEFAGAEVQPGGVNRDMKSKSLQPQRKESRNDLLTPSRTPDNPRSSSTNTPRTPGRSAASGAATPTASNTISTVGKRMSVMPHHATGLGARTISPTDARRMKRLSMAPDAPPMPQSHLPQAPPTPLPEPLPLRSHQNAQSPALNYQKHIIPSPTRTTPDPNHKAYGSAQSLPPSTNSNPVWKQTGPVPPLSLNVSTSTSRLPAPKPRSETVNGIREDVPPVPAIPKAYESPQSELDQPFFSARSSSLPQVDTPVTASPTATTIAEARKIIDMPKEIDMHYHVVPPPSSEPHQQRKQAANMRKKNLQPLRLPPLNLLPLSAPTATKIKVLESEALEDDGSNTPPPRRTNTKTPSTPMTASKATFFSRSQRETEKPVPASVRSSTSYFALRPGSTASRGPSTSPSLPFSFDSENQSLRTISPFTSSSLPQSSAEFASYLRPKFGIDQNRKSAFAKPNGPRMPSFSAAGKNEEKPSAVEPESAFSASAIRRRLSLGKIRNTPKTKDAEAHGEESTKYNNMPPPKLPASATWSNLAIARTSPTQRSQYLNSRRKSSVSSLKTSQPNRHDSYNSEQSSKSEGRPSTDSNRSFSLHPNQSPSLIISAHPVMRHNTSSSSQLRLQETGLDRDDMSAEEEMKKLASKRKDLESAARELDTLRQRAYTREALSPAHVPATNLNIFERGEVVDYKDVYFTGSRNAKKIGGDLHASAFNFGYDDDRGDYNIVEGDHLAYRYEVVDLLGKGSFGQVVRCIDHKTGILVAVKIIRNKKRFHQQALVEVNILQKLREWDPGCKHSVVNFDQSFYFRGHLCISTDLLDMNLYEFIKAHDFRGFSLKLIRRFTKQLLSSLILLHGKKVIHCDLKPENILLAHPLHSEIKVIDFGSSCFENEKVYTYIQSRFYRSPEVILGMSYGMPIDMWSLGCILAELYTGYPIFPGENEQEQLACIMEVFGPPEKHLIEKSSRKKLFFDSMGKPRLTVSSKGRRRRPSSKELRQVLKCEDEAFLDFITRCLRWDPTKRLNPHEATTHEFITGIKVNAARKSQAVVVPSSPFRRADSFRTPGSTRPLPQPPATSFKIGMAVRQSDSASNSPSKPATRRQSTFNGLSSASAAKRASHAAALSSTSKSRVLAGQRSASDRPDLATAAAAASLAR